MSDSLIDVAIETLRPTQMTVGMAEVRLKRQEWDVLSKKQRKLVLRSHVVPCVIGPQGRCYVIDHHHLCLALLEEGVECVWVHALEDLSWLGAKAFWRTMEYHRWVHPYDAAGRRTGYEALPRRWQDMRDDPYRSLAAAVRRAGGYSKEVVPYAEFEWADFFRSQTKLRPGRTVPSRAMRLGLRLAHGATARYLPGWSGRR